jgi:hypothetical protein
MTRPLFFKIFCKLFANILTNLSSTVVGTVHHIYTGLFLSTTQLMIWEYGGCHRLERTQGSVLYYEDNMGSWLNPSNVAALVAVCCFACRVGGCHLKWNLLVCPPSSVV